MKSIKFSVICTVLAVLLCGCGNKQAEDSSSEATIEDVGTENFIQFDEETGRAFVQNEDGSIEYLDEFEEDTGEERITGKYIGLGTKASIPEGWYGISYENSCFFYPDEENENINYFSITTYENAGIDKDSLWSKETLNEGFQSAVEEGVYQTADVVAEYKRSVDTYSSVVFEVEITANDNNKIHMLVYLVDDEQGGHVIMANDTEDEIEVFDKFNSFIESVTFE